MAALLRLRAKPALEGVRTARPRHPLCWILVLLARRLEPSFLLLRLWYPIQFHVHHSENDTCAYTSVLPPPLRTRAAFAATVVSLADGKMNELKG